jgi:hypothetical protein
MTHPEHQPALTISGAPSPEDVAAVVALLAATGGGGPTEPREASTWASHAAALRQPVPHGPGAWRATYRH